MYVCVSLTNSSNVSFQCDPNLQVFNVFIENLDTRLPRIALFSTRTINAGEELTFDYQMKGKVSDSIFLGGGGGAVPLLYTW